MRYKTIRILEPQMCEKFYTSQMGKLFLSMTSKAKALRKWPIELISEKSLKLSYGQQFPQVLTNMN